MVKKMLRIRNRYNIKGDTIDSENYHLQHNSALEEFLEEIYAYEKKATKEKLKNKKDGEI